MRNNCGKKFGPQFLIVVFTAICIFATPALADSLTPRETARILAPDQWQIGVFNPLRLGLSWVEVEIHPLVFLAAPHVDVKVPLTASHPDHWQWTAQLGVGVPTLGWRLAKPMGLAGDLVPSCKVAEHDPSAAANCQRPGWLVVPKFGVWASREYGHVAGAVEQDAIAWITVPPGTAALLVIAFQGLGHIVMDHEPDIRLVDAQAEGDGGDDH